MADDGHDLQLENPTGWLVQPIEGGTHTAIVFKMRNWPLGVALNNNDLSRFSGRIIAEASDFTAKQTPEAPPESLSTNPIPTTSLGIAPHPHDQTSGILAVAVGNLRLTFQVDLSSLFELCETVRTSTTATRPRTKN